MLLGDVWGAKVGSAANEGHSRSLEFWIAGAVGARQTVPEVDSGVFPFLCWFVEKAFNPDLIQAKTEGQGLFCVFD